MTGALTSYHSLRVKGSTIFFFWPFLPPFVKRLFFPTAILIDFTFFLQKREKFSKNLKILNKLKL